jgi:hypothetical protein
VKTAIIISMSVVLLGIIAALVILILSGRDISQFVVFVGGAATTLVPNLFTLLKTSQTQSDVAEIKQQTNGPLSNMQTQVNEIATHIAGGSE